MLNPDTRLHPNRDEVAASVVDGEAIMINLTNGMYFSMDKVGGVVWELIESHQSLGDIVAAIATSYSVPPEQVQTDVERLAADLIRENLVRVAEDESPSDGDQQWELRPGLRYEAPVLNAYHDMAALLAIDPPMPGLLDNIWQEPDDTSLSTPD
jgi:hypothetical protein